MRLEKITAKALKQLDGDRYKLSLIVSKRAEELSAGAKILVKADTNKVKLTDIAIMEVAQGKIGLEALVDKD
ncbi:MAG: DNA-directed RNA polymerase subunit omega [Proteobacteria bacterium]|nr:MAG: DNA-directed RNA polymerase subunit omega [Pseudomonadota bacterium]